MSAPMPSLISPTRCVLLIMDDGVGVYKSTGGGVEFLDTLHWREGGFEEKLSDLISRSGASAVVVLNDAVEQHYRKEKVPVLSYFDKANIIQRRLNVAFPNYSMRAAMPLKAGTKAVREASAADKDAAKGDIYLFAAVPSTDAFGRIMTALSNVDQQVVGYGLLPVESTSLVDTLVKKVSEKRGGGGARWSILISQHRGGGLRQIVVRNNELALTRVTPVVEPDPENPGMWAADVSQELQATLSYLSRFGYTPEDGLELIVIGDPVYTEPLEAMIYAPCNYNVLSVPAAGAMLGIRAQRDELHYADALHAGWSGRKFALDLPLTSRDITAIRQPRQVALGVMTIAAIGLAGVAGVAVDEGMRFYATTVNIEVAQIQKKKIEEIYYEELKRKESMGIDIPLIKGALSINKAISQTVVNPLEVLDAIARSMEDIRLDKFEFLNQGQEPTRDLQPGEVLPPRNTEVALTISFAGNIDIVKGNEEIDKLVARMNERLEKIGYLAKVETPLRDTSFRGASDVEYGVIANKRQVTDRYEAEIRVRKVEKNG